MLYLTLLSLVQSTAALPVAPSESPLTGSPNTANMSPEASRTVYGIVWACLTTTFACTWLAIHPNIPGPYDSSSRIFLRRVRIMILAILVPEYTTVWAFRQWSSARLISKRMSKREEWTDTHSFFLIMGGFMLVDEEGEPIAPLLVRDLCLVDTQLISLPVITEKEIQDRSKGDIVSKTLILLQTTWFLVQVLARVATRLPITELELATVAFASLNLLAYVFWMKKPLNVECTVPVLIRCTDYSLGGRKNSGFPSLDPESFCWASFIEIIMWIFSRLQLFRRTIRQVHSPGFGFPRTDISLSPLEDPYAARHSLTKMPRVQVETFYSGSLLDDVTWGSLSVAGTLQIFLAIYFGAIHCLAWNFLFPTPAIAWIWRISALLLVVPPIYFLFLNVIVVDHSSSPLRFIYLSIIYLFTPLGITPLVRWLARHWSQPLRFLSRLTFITYFIARTILLILPFLLLRDLPARALEEVQWTKYIPHFGPLSSPN